MVSEWGSLSIDNAVIDHYKRRFGTPSREAVFDVRGVPVKVAVWDSGRTAEGVYMYATVGASRQPVGAGGSGHRFELVSGVLPDQPKLAQVLSLAAAYPGLFGEPLGHGHSVRYEKPLWSGTEMRMLLVVRPLNELVPVLDLPDGSHIEFLNAVPAYDDEIEYKAKHGVDQLRAAWQTLAVPFWDPYRPRPRLDGSLPSQ